MIAISKIPISQSNEIIQIIAKFIITFNLQCYYISNTTSRINNFLPRKLLFFEMFRILENVTFVSRKRLFFHAEKTETRKLVRSGVMKSRS